MLFGYFSNCYGIQHFEMPKILEECNTAIIYSPNGVMKTSFAKTLNNIAHGEETKDNIFPHHETKYEIHYNGKTYKNDQLSSNDNIHVIESFNSKLEITKEASGVLLADNNIRKQYEEIIDSLSKTIDEFTININELSAIKKTDIQNTIIKDFNMTTTTYDNWPQIFKILNTSLENFKPIDILKNIKYIELFNSKTEILYRNNNFKDYINDYIEQLNNLIQNNEILSKDFNDYNATMLSKSLNENNIFNVGHSILLQNGIQITNYKQWENLIKTQLDIIYKDNKLAEIFKRINKEITKNEETRILKSIITENKMIISLLKDTDKLKTDLWLTYLKSLNKDFSKYLNNTKFYQDKLQNIYKMASEQHDRWISALNIFKNRFSVPFEINIQNKKDCVLKGTKVLLEFSYKQNSDTNILSRDQLINVLSTGENRALYLLHVLFNLEYVKEQSKLNTDRYLVIADDIVDSFDYKNKYAIVEYLVELTSHGNIDLILLTHNFDFYRTMTSRISHNEHYIVEKFEDNSIILKKYQYVNNIFNKLKESLKQTNFETSSNYNKLVSLFACIPFYRNLSEYLEETRTLYDLTCLLHIKETPINTHSVKILDICNILKMTFNLEITLPPNDEYLLYIPTIKDICSSIANRNTETANLENKILLSIGIRLVTEIYLKNILLLNGYSGENIECKANQTREWSKLAIENNLISAPAKALIDEVNIMTPENIHINSFMYEPIIDMSDWALKNLYNKVLALN